MEKKNEKKELKVVVMNPPSEAKKKEMIKRIQDSLNLLHNSNNK